MNCYKIIKDIEFYFLKKKFIYDVSNIDSVSLNQNIKIKWENKIL